MTVQEFADAHAFLEHARPFLFNDELKNNLLLSSVITLSKSERQPSLIFLAVGRPVTGAALRSPNHRWIVEAQDLESARTLAQEIERRESKTPSRLILANREHAHQFAKFPERASQNLMVLKTLARFAQPAAGLLRLATAKDLNSLKTWSKNFASELDLDETPTEAEDAIKRTIENKLLYVWTDEGKIVAMAATGGFTPKAARISMVYTDPQQRGKHYASTLVHRVCHKLKQDGKTPLLLADAKNSQTKHIYESLGFRTITEICELKSPQDSKSQSPDSGRKPAASSH